MTTLPVIEITIVHNGAGYVVRDNGGDFRTAAEINRDRADGEARRRMEHYTEFGYPVLPWTVPA